MIFIEIF